MPRRVRIPSFANDRLNTYNEPLSARGEIQCGENGSRNNGRKNQRDRGVQRSFGTVSGREQIFAFFETARHDGDELFETRRQTVCTVTWNFAETRVIERFISRAKIVVRRILPRARRFSRSLRTIRDRV